MRNVILQEFVSLDALAAGSNDGVDFISASMAGDPSFGRRQLPFIDSVDAILLGRKTYEMFAAYWPNVTTGEDKEFADRINAIPKIVFSRTLDRAPWGGFDAARVVRTNASDEVRALRKATGKDMVIWGSISLAQTLLSDDLIDEVQLVVCPVVLGKGRPLFAGNGRSLDMKLLRTESFDRGAVLLSYKACKQ